MYMVREYLSAIYSSSELPHPHEYTGDLHMICGALQRAHICQGNAESDFITLLESREGVIRSIGGGVAAYIDNVSKTVCHQNCSLLCEPGAVRCQVCRHYRATLRALKCKNQLNKDSKTSHDSHTNY